MGWRSVRCNVLVVGLCVFFASTAMTASARQGDGQDPGLPSELSPPSTGSSSGIPATFPDQDGMLPPVLDPDDDDDGVQDADDSHPNDPTRGEKPPPGPTDPIADDDGDGLPNVMDPDDNSNGIPDAEDGVGTKDPVPPVVPESPGAVNPQAPDAEPPGSTDENGGPAPLVRALPSTGTGSAGPRPSIPIFLIGSILLLATGHWSRRRSRP